MPWRPFSFALHDRWESFNQKLKSRLPKPSAMQESRIGRFFGKTLLRPEIWSFKEEPVARGTALGLFVAFTPTIGIQMALSCVAVLFYPGNLPIALAICWLTNPVTAAPIYYAEYLFGAWLLGLIGYMPDKVMEEGVTLTSLSEVGWTLWFGSIIASLAMAVIGYWLIHGFMALERRVRFEKLLHLRRKRKESPPPGDKELPPDGGKA